MTEYNVLKAHLCQHGIRKQMLNLITIHIVLHCMCLYILSTQSTGLLTPQLRTTSGDSGGKSPDGIKTHSPISYQKSTTSQRKKPVTHIYSKCKCPTGER